MNIFMLSNGKLPGSKILLDYAIPALNEAFQQHQVKRVLVIPYAVIRLSYEQRVQSVREAFANTDVSLEISGIHEYQDPIAAIYQSDAILVSGGNTWYLNKALHDYGLIEPIREAVLHHNTIYVGWSAGAVICAPNMCTTNDMCIVDAAITASLGFVPFHINAHYIEATIENHMGETRDERILEFCLRNPYKSVIGIPEGTWLHLNNQGLSYHSPQGKPLTHFCLGQEKRQLNPSDDLTSLMQRQL